MCSGKFYNLLLTDGALRKGCVSSLVIFSFFKVGCGGFYYTNYQRVTK